jgi:hypothetical protein
VSVSGSGGGAVFVAGTAGATSLIASFGPGSDQGGVAEAAAALSVLNGTTVGVASMTLELSSLLYGEVGATFGSTLLVALDDGTQYGDVHALGWLDAAALVGYSSDTPTAVTVDAAGALTLLGNHEVLVGITATTACTPFVSASASTAPNLKVGFRGVDLGANDGLQFAMSGGAVAVPVLVNAQGVQLTSFQIVVGFDATLLRATGYTEGVGGGSGAGAAFSGPSVTLNDPVDEVLLVGNKDGAIAPSGLVQLATLSLLVQARRRPRLSPG